MADPKKNPLIGAFRTPVPNTPPNTPTPPAEQPPPHEGAAADRRYLCVDSTYCATGTAPAPAIRSLASVEVAKSKKA